MSYRDIGEQYAINVYVEDQGGKLSMGSYEPQTRQPVTLCPYGMAGCGTFPVKGTSEGQKVRKMETIAMEYVNWGHSIHSYHSIHMLYWGGFFLYSPKESEPDEIQPSTLISQIP